jgi:hypothetical protein
MGLVIWAIYAAFAIGERALQQNRQAPPGAILENSN